MGANHPQCIAYGYENYKKQVRDFLVTAKVLDSDSGSNSGSGYGGDPWGGGGIDGLGHGHAGSTWLLLVMTVFHARGLLGPAHGVPEPSADAVPAIVPSKETVTVLEALAVPEMTGVEVFTTAPLAGVTRYRSG